MVRVAVLGVGHFGRFHALKAAKAGPLELVAVHDADPARAAAMAAELGVPALAAAAAIDAAEAVIVAAPTRHHASLGTQALEAGRHLFMEKPLAATLPEAEALAALAAARGLVLQVGHIERFSAAFQAVAAASQGLRALHWEAVRVAPFRPRSLDVSVVLDLMIHDIDLVLHLAGAEPVSIRAVGARIASPHADMAVAQLGFADGRAATITASRAAVAMERRLRVLTTEGEMRVDFLARSLARVARGGAAPLPDMPGFGLETAGWTDHDSLEAQQASFAAACQGAKVLVGAAEGLAALRVARMIEAQIEG